MHTSLQLVFSSLILFIVAVPLVAADKSDAKSRVEQVVKAVGGEDHLLNLFRYRERVLVTATPAPPVTADEKGNRTSVVEIAGDIWLGTTKRDKDKVRVLCWAWSLRILLDPKSKVESIADTTIAEKPVFGLRVTESISNPIDLYFDKKTQRLVAIDYTDTRHLFSQWKTTEGDHHYPSHVVGYRFTDRDARLTNANQWYQTDILELTPLEELPPELRTDSQRTN
jgi:hypothetical protein